MKEIILGKGQVCLVDDEDFDELNKHKWYMDKVGYARRASRRDKNYKQKSIFVHRVVMKAEKGEIIDHINHNPLDNRKENLRKVSHIENRMNNKSKGYSWNNNDRKWKAQIRIKNKLIYLGYFDTEEEAKEARRLGEIKYFGEFANKSKYVAGS